MRSTPHIRWLSLDPDFISNRTELHRLSADMPKCIQNSQFHAVFVPSDCHRYVSMTNIITDVTHRQLHVSHLSLPANFSVMIGCSVQLDCKCSMEVYNLVS